MSGAKRVVLVGSLLTVVARAAGAEEAPQEAPDVVVERAPSIDVAAQAGLLLPLALTPRVGDVAAIGMGLGGYDSARRTGIATAAVEARIWGPIALRAGAAYSASRDGARPTVGARAQLLQQSAHGVDGALGVFYRPEGFTEPEGEIETFICVGRRWDRLSLIGNLVYGQDPEGNERDGEVRLGALYGKQRWTFGVDSRMRFAIGAQRSAQAMAEPKFDLLAGPIATVTVGPLALLAEAGPSILRVGGQTSVGVVAMAGIGAVF